MKLQLTVEGDEASTGTAAWAELPDVTGLLLCVLLLFSGTVRLSLPCLEPGLLWTTEVCPEKVHVHFGVSLNRDLLPEVIVSQSGVRRRLVVLGVAMLL